MTTPDAEMCITEGRFFRKQAPLRCALALVITVAACFPQSVCGQAADPAQREFFERKIRPILVAHCYECHSHGAKILRGNLLLDSRDALLRGGDSGAALIPKDPQASLLIQAVEYEGLEMPPQGKLPRQAVALLNRWVLEGAIWPDDPAPSQPRTSPVDFDWQQARESHWSFRPLGDPTPPAVRRQDWVQQPLDQFILAKLEGRGLRPAPQADRRTLIRRASFDLTGLPPTSDQVERFVHDDRADAFAHVIDELLASPHYGERWGRHWLDVARYSDGYGGFNDKQALPAAWRYRDWVVAALNRDLPYDEFVRQQIAGDLLPVEGGDLGTGFLAIGPTYTADGGDPESVALSQAETLDDRVDTVTKAFLGLTVSCSRCHDHKFDPIPQIDYYALAGVFNNTRLFEKPLASPEVVAAYDSAQKQITEAEAQYKKIRAIARKEGRDPTADERQQVAVFSARFKQLKAAAPSKYPFALVCAEAGSQDMAVARRGNPLAPGAKTQRRFLRIVAGEDAPLWNEGSGRRQLADAIVHSDNPLTARVIVNRVWMWHFGEPLVRTPNNFGSLGEPPVHAELLDWLASRLMEFRWSLKTLHRLIMLSASYQMSGDFNEEAYQADGDNRLLWRMNPRRLQAEEIRDAMLFVSGELDLTLGGAPAKRILSSPRRTLYGMVSRSGDAFEGDAFLKLFNFPDPRSAADQRVTTIVPAQHLFLLNSSFVCERAQALASQLESAADNDAARIHLAYECLFGRPPAETEQQLGQEYLSLTRARADEGQPGAWQRFAQALLLSNEFLFLR